MTEYWSGRYSNSSNSGSKFVLPDAREDILKLSLNIICGAGFGVKLPFKPALKVTADEPEDLFKDAVVPSSGYTFTLRGVMEYINRSLMSVFVANGILPKWISRSILPFLKRDFAAHGDLGNYLHALVEDAEKSDSETHNLLGRVVRSRREEQEVTTKRNPGLTDSEILGNLFIFSIAGHETTATTLRFALALLAIHSDAQEELYEELQTVLQDQPPDAAEWDFATVFPRLITPLCIMVGSNLTSDFL